MSGLQSQASAYMVFLRSRPDMLSSAPEIPEGESRRLCEILAVCLRLLARHGVASGMHKHLSGMLRCRKE